MKMLLMIKKKKIVVVSVVVLLEVVLSFALVEFVARFVIENIVVAAAVAADNLGSEFHLNRVFVFLVGSLTNYVALIDLVL